MQKLMFILMTQSHSWMFIICSLFSALRGIKIQYLERSLMNLS